MIVLALGLGLAAWIDRRTQTIPNWLTLPLVIGGLAWSGWMGLAGAVVALGVLLPEVLRGRVGPGDLKLLAAIGAWLGPLGVIVTMGYTYGWLAWSRPSASGWTREPLAPVLAVGGMTAAVLLRIWG